jgi:cystathionine beta-lyase/cystathionine gamma-synthase
VKIQTKAVHAGDRKKAGAHVPVTTPIFTASSYFYDSMEELDRIFGREDPGYCYSRYDNPTNAALEEQAAALESGHGALACSSGMMAIHMALLAALADRRKSVLAANALVRRDDRLADECDGAVRGERALRGCLRSGRLSQGDGGIEARLRAGGDDFESAAAGGCRSTASPKSCARRAGR